MCRHYCFRANAPTKVECTLIRAQNALISQSRADRRGVAHPDGWGVAVYDNDHPWIERRAAAAYEDLHFSTTAERVYAETVVAHVRKATVGEPSLANTHPFAHACWTFTHNGTVTAHSPGVGLGAKFSIRLPLFLTLEIAAPEAGTSTHDQEIDLSELRPDILVVDDNKDAADSLAMHLQMEGHRVHVAYDPHTALERAQSTRPSVMVLDIGLPGMDGFELARELRQRPETASATFIALTGYGQDQDRRRVRESGFDHHKLAWDSDPVKSKSAAVTSPPAPTSAGRPRRRKRK